MQKLFLQIITCGYILAKLLKKLSFPHKQRWKFFTSYFSAKTVHNYCRKHRKFAKFIILHNRTQLMRKFSPIVSKLAFSHVSQQLSNIQSTNCSHTNYKKRQLTAHTSIVKRYTAKCYKHAPFLFKSTLLWSLVLANQLTSPHKTQKQTNIAHSIITI